MCGLVRRYGSAEPTLSVALLRFLENDAAVLPADAVRWAAALSEQADSHCRGRHLHIAQPADLAAVTAAGAALQDSVRRHRER